MIATIVGWIGTFCFAFCGVPLAIQCVRQGHAKSLSPCFLVLWTVGEFCYVAAVLHDFGWVGWMMFNYLLNIACALVIWKYYFSPRLR